jgi:hypothetical protein
VGNNLEKLPIKKRIFVGTLSGLFFAVTMSAFDYFSHNPFSLTKFLFLGFFFGLVMSFALRHKVTKDKR